MEKKKYIYQCEAFTSIGPKFINQDSFSIDAFVQNTEPLDTLSFCVTLEGDEKSHVAAVADGVTNGAFGELCSKTVIETITDAYSQDAFHSLDDLSTAYFDHLMSEASEKMAERLSEKGCGQYNGATTASLVVFNQDQILAYNIGDSPIFLIRGEKMLPLFEEDSLGAEKERFNNSLNLFTRFYKQKKIEARDYHVLTRCVSTSRQNKSQGHCRTQHWEEEDVILLCSDGLTDVVSEEDLIQLSKENGGAKKMVELAYRQNLSDNITVILIRKKEGNLHDEI